MDWFRFYHAVLDDPKVQELSPVLFKHWVNLMCLASQTVPRGTLPDLNSIAFRLRLQRNRAASVIAELDAVGLIDHLEEGIIAPHNWGARQRQSDDVAERVRRHRGKESRNGSVTLHETPLKLSRATETETEQIPPPPPSAAASPEDDEEAFSNTYVETIGASLPKVIGQFTSLHQQLTDAWFRVTLAKAAAQVGPLPRDRLGPGLLLAADQIRRDLDAGGVRNPRSIAQKHIIDYLTEQRDGIPISNGAANGVRAGPVQATAGTSPDRR